MGFPIDATTYQPLTFSFSESSLSHYKKEQLETNIRFVRDSIVFMTAYANAKGIGGHTGGAYDIVPEALIVQAFARGEESVHPVLFDAAGHRVALQYTLAALNGHISLELLLKYREFDSKLPGHPERGSTPGIHFSSGRLGHLWGFVNGVALGNPGKQVVLFSSDGSLQEGGDAEAARFAVSRGLDVKVLIDDNNVTIAGHPSDYMKGFDVVTTLRGQGMTVFEGPGEGVESLYWRIIAALKRKGPIALVNKRVMAPGIPQVEGTPKGHDAVGLDAAVEYFEARENEDAIALLKSARKQKDTWMYRGSSGQTGKTRDEFGKAVVSVLSKMDLEEVQRRFRVFDNDLEGSCGLHHIRKAFPGIFESGGIMERHNFSAAAGFGSGGNRMGLYATFSAFSEMVISEITMARLNKANVLAHFSHAGVDWMADNTCHFGINNMFVDNGLADDESTRLYMPADAAQMHAIVERVFFDAGLRFIFSTRSPTPYIEREDGDRMFTSDYKFEPGCDELIREGEGIIVSYGDMLYRCLDAVERVNESNYKVGLINKPTLNTFDEDMLRERYRKAPYILFVESQSKKSGVGVRFGNWLKVNGVNAVYDHLGTTREGNGGIEEQITHQELDSNYVAAKVMNMHRAAQHSQKRD